MPAIPAMRKYVWVRSKRGDWTRAVIVEAALISASPVTSWQMDPCRVQWAWGKRGENPGTVMLCSSTLNSGMPCHASPSESNYERKLSEMWGKGEGD